MNNVLTIKHNNMISNQNSNTSSNILLTEVDNTAPSQANQESQVDNTNRPQAVSNSVKIFAIIVVILIVAVLLYSQYTNKSKETTIEEGNIEEQVDTSQTEEMKVDYLTEIKKNSNYKNYSDEILSSNQSSSIVLFFTANWCLSCSELEIDIVNNHKNIPSNLLILNVDYDNNKELTEKYKVDVPHTLIVLDNTSKEVNRFQGTPNLEELLQKL